METPMRASALMPSMVPSELQQGGGTQDQGNHTEDATLTAQKQADAEQPDARGNSPRIFHKPP